METDKSMRMMLMPPVPGTCPWCAVKHDPGQPHNRDSLYYQYKFYFECKRWPTWGDAMAHCAEDVKAFWREQLMEKGVSAEQLEVPDGERVDQSQ